MKNPPPLFEDLFTNRQETELQLVERNIRIMIRMFGRLTLDQINNLVERERSMYFNNILLNGDLNKEAALRRIRDLTRYGKLLNEQQRLSVLLNKPLEVFTNAETFEETQRPFS